MDVLTESQRSYNMSRIKSKNTKPEMFIRHSLWGKGYRYHLCDSSLPGKPDLVFSGKKKVIFINGCFWHMHNCDYFKMPKTNADFWEKKLQKNRERDTLDYKMLHRMGWKYRTVWECQIKKDRTKVLRSLTKFLDEA